MTPEKLLAIAALALSDGKDIGGLSEVEFAEKMELESEYYGGTPWKELFLYFYEPPNTASTGQAASSAAQ